MLTKTWLYRGTLHGVFLRTEFRRIFINTHDAKFVEAMFSPWGGIFVHLARLGKVAFRDMESRDFDMISAEPVQMFDEVLPGLLSDYFLHMTRRRLPTRRGFSDLGKMK